MGRNKSHPTKKRYSTIRDVNYARARVRALSRQIAQLYQEIEDVRFNLNVLQNNFGNKERPANNVGQRRFDAMKSNFPTGLELKIKHLKCMLDNANAELSGVKLDLVRGQDSHTDGHVGLDSGREEQMEQDAGTEENSDEFLDAEDGVPNMDPTVAEIATMGGEGAFEEGVVSGMGVEQVASSDFSDAENGVANMDSTVAVGLLMANMGGGG